MFHQPTEICRKCNRMAGWREAGGHRVQRFSESIRKVPQERLVLKLEAHGSWRESFEMDRNLLTEQETEGSEQNKHVWVNGCN